jgi:hypothetical protein
MIMWTVNRRDDPVDSRDSRICRYEASNELGICRTVEVRVTRTVLMCDDSTLSAQIVEAKRTLGESVIAGLSHWHHLPLLITINDLWSEIFHSNGYVSRLGPGSVLAGAGGMVEGPLAEDARALLYMDPEEASVQPRRPLDEAEARVLDSLLETPPFDTVAQIDAELSRGPLVPYEAIEDAVDLLMARGYLVETSAGHWRVTDAALAIKSRLLGSLLRS